MGIPVTLTLYAPDEAAANLASRAAYDRIRQIDRIMSDYDPDSELMKLCTRSEVGKPVAVSSELFEVLAAADELSRRTDGAFDVTVGPVVRLWRVARRRKVLPDPERLTQALRSVGFRNLRLDHQARTVTLLQPDMRIDLGGIAKGYAADEALKTLAGLGVTRALVDMSGDIVVGDPPPDREHWVIAIENARVNNRESPQQHIRLRNAAVATSGDAYQHVEIDGVRYSHLVDPKTGLGLTAIGSVTVIAPNGMQADALASAVSILPEVAGIELIEATDETEACMVRLRKPEEIETVRSSRFESFLSEQAPPQ